LSDIRLGNAGGGIADVKVQAGLLEVDGTAGANPDRCGVVVDLSAYPEWNGEDITISLKYVVVDDGGGVSADGVDIDLAYYLFEDADAIGTPTQTASGSIVASQATTGQVLIATTTLTASDDDLRLLALKFTRTDTDESNLSVKILSVGIEAYAV